MVTIIILSVLLGIAFLDRVMVTKKLKKVLRQRERDILNAMQADEIEQKRRLELKEKGANIEEWFATYDKGELVEIFQHDEDSPYAGLKWYTFADIQQIPARRGVLAELTTKYIEMNVTPEVLNQYVEKMLEEINQGKMSKVATLLERLNERLKWNCEEETLIQFAKVYFMLEGEPITAGSIQYGKRKDEILRTDMKARAFFLLSAFKLTKNFSGISNEHILAYLKEKALAAKEDTMILTSQ